MVFATHGRKKTDPEEMEQLVKAGAPLAIHGFTKALQQAVKDDPRYELIERMCDVLMFFYEKDGVGAYWLLMILCIILMWLTQRNMRKRLIR